MDALPPNVLNAVLESSIEDYLDTFAYEQIVSREEADKAKLIKLKSML